jgi:hypothetical protein
MGSNHEFDCLVTYCNYDCLYAFTLRPKTSVADEGSVFHALLKALTSFLSVILEYFVSHLLVRV